MATYRRRFGPNEGWLVYESGDVQLGATVVVNGPAVHKQAVQLDEALEDVQRALSEIACGVVAGNGCTRAPRQVAVDRDTRKGACAFRRACNNAVWRE